MVLLGVPHCSRSDRKTVLQERCAAILSLSGLARRVVQRLQSEVLFDLCCEFDSVGVKITTISVYEQKPTKIVTGSLRSARIEVSTETLFMSTRLTRTSSSIEF